MLLLDTNIISELSRRQPDPGVLAWAGGVREFRFSAISLEEIALALVKTPSRFSPARPYQTTPQLSIKLR
jgi:predicted nucleic acid-binding protein